MAATFDILPTVCVLTGAALPKNKIDGLSLARLLADKKAASPRENYHYYYGRELRAVRQGPWKLVFPHQYRSLTGEPGKDGFPGGYTQEKCQLELYHLASDRGESKDVSEQNPEIVKRLQEMAQKMRDQLGDSLTQSSGKEIRPSGKIGKSR